MHKVENLLCNIFDGGTVQVYFRFQDTGKAVLARHMAIKDDPLLRAELERILGKDCVKVQNIEQLCKNKSIRFARFIHNFRAQSVV